MIRQYTILACAVVAIVVTVAALSLMRMAERDGFIDMHRGILPGTFLQTNIGVFGSRMDAMIVTASYSSRSYAGLPASLLLYWKNRETIRRENAARREVLDAPLLFSGPLASVSFSSAATLRPTEGGGLKICDSRGNAIVEVMPDKSIRGDATSGLRALSLSMAEMRLRYDAEWK